MDYSTLMKMCHAEHELSKDPPSLARRKPSPLDEIVEELPSATKLGHEIDGGFGSDDLVQREDVLVSKASVVMQLSSEERQRRGRVRRGALKGLGDDLDGHSSVGESVYAEFDGSKSACSGVERMLVRSRSVRIAAASAHLVRWSDPSCSRLLT